ncbi:UMP kinase [Myxococcota bacterium]|nr:UMP kinase [Myxococcota bacterium]
MPPDSASQGPRFRRVLLKLSGEALQGHRSAGVDPEVVTAFAQEVKGAREMGAQMALVIGGGNYFRGISEVGRQFDRATADTVGMLATVMNALVFCDVLERLGQPTRVMTALQMPQVAEPFIRRRAIRHMEKGRVVLLAAGTGHPFFSTDTAAVLRALEIQADAVLKGTKVDGVYTADPARHADAVRYDRVSFSRVLEEGLGVMDATAIALCREHRLPLVVFDIRRPGNLVRLLSGESIGTEVIQEEEP